MHLEYIYKQQLLRLAVYKMVFFFFLFLKIYVFFYLLVDLLLAIRAFCCFYQVLPTVSLVSVPSVLAVPELPDFSHLAFVVEVLILLFSSYDYSDKNMQ